jgi:hypothetical protein
MKGLVALARDAAMKSPGACSAATHQVTSMGGASYRQLDRNEDPMHPGESSA